MNGSTKSKKKKKGKKTGKKKKVKPAKEISEAEIFLTKMSYQFWLSITFFMIFFTILMYTIFIYQDESQSVISIAGIFSAWMGAIIAFYFMEHRTSETVFTVKKAEEDVRNQLKSLESETDEKDKYWDKGTDQLLLDLKTRSETIEQLQSDLKKIAENPNLLFEEEAKEEKEEEPPEEPEEPIGTFITD